MDLSSVKDGLELKEGGVEAVLVAEVEADDGALDGRNDAYGLAFAGCWGFFVMEGL